MENRETQDESGLIPSNHITQYNLAVLLFLKSLNDLSQIFENFLNLQFSN